jgi:hypothetical protein
LQPPAGNELWPSVRARIALQTVNVSPLAFSSLTSPSQGLRSAAVLGDYVFAQPSFGSFRATSGVMLGSHGQLPQFGMPAMAETARLGLSLDAARGLPSALKPEAWQASPYLGLGFSSSLGSHGFSLSADLGWIAENLPSSGSLHAPLGVQGSDIQRREMRLSPLLQFGMRYTF